MKKNIVKIFIAIIAIVLVISLNRYHFQGTYITITGFTQGTTYLVKYENKDRKNLQPEIDSLLAGFDLSLSTYIPESVISKVNFNDSNAVLDNHFVKVFNKAQEVYEKSGGAFDITIAPIVNAWGFGFTEKADTDSAAIDSLLQFVGMEKVCIEHGKVAKKYPQIMLDVNAIAQGYSVDVVSDFLEKKGIKNYLVEIGGEVRAKGKNPSNKIWIIGIDKPVDNNIIPGRVLQSKLRLKNSSLATSGNYRKFFEEDGQKYVHSINPETGYPVISNLLSVTVMAEDCMTADAWATAFMVMGMEKSIEHLSGQNELEAYLIYSDKKGNYLTYTTKNLKRFIEE